MPQKTINQTRWISKGGIQFNLMVWVTKKKSFWGDTTNYKTYKVYIHSLQLADNRTVKDRGQTNPDRGFPESLLPVKGLQRSLSGVNDNLRRCCVLLTTWPMCNTPGYVSSYKCGTKCINFDVASASRGILLFPMGNTFGQHLQDGIERHVLQNSWNRLDWRCLICWSKNWVEGGIPLRRLVHLVVVGGGKYVGAVHQLIALDDDDGGALGS